MTVFDTEMHISIFLISLFELVFFFYQIIYYLARPSDKKALLFAAIPAQQESHDLAKTYKGIGASRCIFYSDPESDHQGKTLVRTQ